jgi:hypothetical protein
MDILERQNPSESIDREQPKKGVLILQKNSYFLRVMSDSKASYDIYLTIL